MLARFIAVLLDPFGQGGDLRILDDAGLVFGVLAQVGAIGPRVHGLPFGARLVR
ncbi:hypothetical protein D3C72_2394610 [compost metagenome]